MTLDHAIERLHTLKVDTTTRDGDRTPHEEPQGSAGVPPASSPSNAAKMAALPTNGLALCKNHHRAMDRDIIAPGPDLRWHVSKLIDPRRSNGERELAELSGKSLLLPKDRAFHPDAEEVTWRFRQLSA